MFAGKGQSLAGLVLADDLLDLFQHAALADRSALMGTGVLIGEKFTTDMEYADIEILAGQHLAAGILKILLLSGKQFGHRTRFPSMVNATAQRHAHPCGDAMAAKIHYTNKSGLRQASH